MHLWLWQYIWPLQAVEQLLLECLFLFHLVLGTFNPRGPDPAYLEVLSCLPVVDEGCPAAGSASSPIPGRSWPALDITLRPHTVVNQVPLDRLRRWNSRA